MSAALLHKLVIGEIELHDDGEELEIRAPEGRLTPALRAIIEANEAELRALVRGLPFDVHHFINRICLGNALHLLKQLPDNSVDQIATDPPYGLKFMGKKWDKALVDSAIWRECLRVLKPGGFAFVFAAPRQDVLSRVIVDLEDAGFETGFTSLYWTYATGFPKAHNISKAVDRKLGAERVIVGERAMPDLRGGNYGQGQRRYTGITVQDTLPATAQAEALIGSYAGFQPKPAVEVILVVMKPLDQKNYTTQAMETGKGVTWLDDCRIPYGHETPTIGNRHQHDRGKGYGFKPQWHQKAGVRWSPEKEWKQDIERQAHEKGRFPANLIVSDSVIDDGRRLNQGHWVRSKTTGYGEFGGGRSDYQGPGNRLTPDGYSRYFSLDAWAEVNIPDLQDQVRRSLPFLITPKASTKEKDEGLLGLQATSIKGRDTGQDTRNVPQKARPSRRLNTHPTVKPITLMAYLITMGSKEGDIVLDPFAGSGSTLIAAQKLNRRFIGVELEPEYYRIAKKRLAFYVREIEKSQEEESA